MIAFARALDKLVVDAAPYPRPRRTEHHRSVDKRID